MRVAAVGPDVIGHGKELIHFRMRKNIRLKLRLHISHNGISGSKGLDIMSQQVRTKILYKTDTPFLCCRLPVRLVSGKRVCQFGSQSVRTVVVKAELVKNK